MPYLTINLYLLYTLLPRISTIDLFLSLHSRFQDNVTIRLPINASTHFVPTNVNPNGMKTDEKIFRHPNYIILRKIIFKYHYHLQEGVRAFSGVRII